jgi:type IV pilus assembly protein PilC
MKFKYKIINSKGEKSEGVKESPDKFTLAREFKQSGDTPISIQEAGEGSGGSGLHMNINIKIFNGVSLANKIMFTNNLSGMLSAGLSLSRALQVLAKQSVKGSLHDIIQSLVDDIDKGNTLSSAMAKFPKVFSGIFVSMVHSGEESGSLPKTLNEVGLNLKKSYDLNKKVKGALMYPSIIVAAIFLIGVLMMIYVVPTLTATFKELGADLPFSTRSVIWLSDALSQHTLLFLLVVGIVSGAGFLFARLPSTQKYFDFLIIRVPVMGGIIREMNAARTTRTLSSLLLSGVDMSHALAITEEVLQNVYYKKVIHDAVTAIEKGIPLSTGFKENTKLYPVMVGEMIEVGEETGKLSDMLLDVATFYENEVDNKTKDLSTIIEPVLMVFIGAAVGFFAISMITPIYSVMDNIK